MINHLIDYAKSFLGLPYIWGGDHPSLGFDCSGLAQEILSAGDVDPQGDQTAHGLYTYFRTAGKPCKPQAGALCFYGKNGTVTHVAWMISEYLIIEAGGGGSDCVDVKSAVQSDAFVRIRPYYYRKDLAEILMPKYPEWVING